MAKEGYDGGSFRDPAGFVFTHGQQLYRQVNAAGKEDYELFMQSGLYKELVDAELIIPHKEVSAPKDLRSDARRYKVLRPDAVPFISYPYEWTFDQLKAAALLTLAIQKRALQRGMILKDSSAYNVQFIGTKPVFIDTLSFARYEVGGQWEGYKQFCEHFVAPLALVHYSSQRTLKLLRANIDGLPLNMACQLLPAKARLRSGLLAHLYLHNSSQRRHQTGGAEVAAKAKQRKMTLIAMQGLIASLERTIKKLRAPEEQTEWGDYYSFTNYSDDAFMAKRKLLGKLLDAMPKQPKVVWDIGANNGEFSEVAAERGAYTIAFDIDEVAVSRNFLAKRPEVVRNRLLPLVQDLTNPSPALGWAHEERMSLLQRGPADVVFALAIIHHLSIGNNLPFEKVAQFLQRAGKYVIIEFVPKGDSKVDHLLASRKDIFGEYDQKHFEAAFETYFTQVEKRSVKGSKRSVYLYKAKRIS